MILALLACAPEPAAPWVPGELVIEQIGLDGVALGEATLVIGPDGTALLVDVGNDAHTREVEEALERHGVTPSFVVITHLHADHLGGLADLGLDAPVVWRGPYDIDARAANAGEWEEACEGAAEAVDLCDGEAPAPCDLDGDDAPWPASSCGGWSADLGEGATFEVLAANGWHGGERFDLGYDDEEDENARSLVGAVTWGDFTWIFAGDLTGGGKDTPDVEGWLAPRLGLDADVLLLAHHGIRSSTQDAWVDAVLGGEGDHHAIVGATNGYLAAPAQEVLDRVAPRLGGGDIWATEDGMTAGEHARLKVAHGGVVVRVTMDGYGVEG